MQMKGMDVFVEALLASGSVKEAAANAGISIASAYRYTKLPEFKETYAKRQRDILNQATGHLVATLQAAVIVVKEVMLDTDTAAQTKLVAARTILEYAGKYLETTDVLARLEALEDTVSSNSKKVSPD